MQYSWKCTPWKQVWLGTHSLIHALTHSLTHALHREFLALVPDICHLLTRLAEDMLQCHINLNALRGTERHRVGAGQVAQVTNRVQFVYLEGWELTLFFCVFWTSACE